MLYLVAGGVLAYFILALKKPVPAAGLLLGLAPAYLVRLRIFGIPTTLLELLLLAFILAVVLTSSKGRYSRLFRKLRPVSLPLVLFVLAAIISTALSPEKSKAVGELKAFFVEPILLFGAFLMVLENKEQVRQLLKWLFGAAIAVSVFGIAQYFTGFLLPIRFWGYGLEPRRISSFFDYPNALALYLAPLAALYLHLLLEKIFRPGAWFGWSLMVVALGLTFSRGGWLGLAGAAFVVLALKFSFKRTVLVAGCLLALLLISPLTRVRIFSAFQDPSSLAHQELLSAGWQEVKSSPILGNGLYGFRTTLAQANFTGEILNYPHDIFLNFWLETGLLGLLSFVAVSLMAVFLAIRKPTVFRWAAVAYLIALWLHGLVDVPYFKNDLSVLFWFVIALSLSDD
ncbi:MAG: O-antigen ligase family protein [Candidatus Saccharibacteria bacterium]